MQRRLVDESRWISQRRFLHALNYCMLLPGPEAQQLAIYVGWLLNGTLGGLIAGTLFVLPGVIAMLALSVLYVGAGSTTFVAGLFAGLAPAVIAIVVQAVHRVGKRALHHGLLVAMALGSFVALAVFKVPFPFVVISAGILGWILGFRVPAIAHHGTPADVVEGREPLVSDDALHTSAPSARRGLGILVAGLALWFAPVALAALVFSRHSVFVDQGLFFSGAAVVTFGGAYAVLSYVAHQAVYVFGWLKAGEMVRGLALAESTPGPLIMVVQFVAFVGAFRNPGSLYPWVAAVLASVLVTWVTFVPCFLFIFLGAPYVERLRNNQHLTAALTGITAAVVGVIANLAVFFALHNLFARARTVAWGPIDVDIPVFGSWDPTAFAITAIALALIFWRKWSTLRTLGTCALVGLAAQLLHL
jgi:chromate transporter